MYKFPEKKIENIVFYLRVSTPEQVDFGNGLETQQGVCESFANRNNYNIIKIFTEKGESGSTMNRTQLKIMLEYCRNNRNQIDAIVIYKIDRMARNTDDYTLIRMELNQLNIRIISATENIDSTPMGRFSETILSAQAELDNSYRSERTITGNIQALEEGRYIFRPPLGYKRIRNPKVNIVPKEHEKDYVRDVFLEIIKGEVNLDGLRRILNKKYDLSIPKSTFCKIPTRKAYCGLIDKYNKEWEMKYEPIISKNIFLEAQDILNQKNRKIRNKKYLSINEDFPLRKFVINSKGRCLTGSYSRGNGGKYPYYRFMGDTKGFPKDVIESAFREFLEKYSFSEEILDLLNIAIEEKWKENNKNILNDKKVYNKKITELKEEKTKIIDKNLKGIIPDDMVKDYLQKKEEEIRQFETKVFEAENIIQFDKELLKQSLDNLNNIVGLWKSLKVEGKDALQWFLFPENVIFENNKFRTTKTAFILNKKSAFESQLSLNG